MTDLDGEFADAVCSITPERLAWLRTANIPDEVIFAEPPLVGFAQIELYRGGLYEPRDEGLDAVIVPVHADGLADLVAFRPSLPGRWWRRLGAVPVLGEENMRRFQVDPLRVCATPLDWLRGGGRGVVIIDWLPDPADLLLGAGALTTDPRTLQKMRSRSQDVALGRVNRMFTNG